MRSLITATALVSVSLFAVCSAHAFVYYVEAENFDVENSSPVEPGCIWEEIQDRDAFNEAYMQYSGAHAGAKTSLLYPISKVTDSQGPWRIWILCNMPDGGSDSYFFYVSTDGGSKWGPQQTAHGSGQGPDWKWESWVLSTPLEKGEGNVLRIAERENSKADLICIRNDNLVPSEEEYEKWLEEHKDGNIAVEPLHRITTTWGNIRSAY